MGSSNRDASGIEISSESSIDTRRFLSSVSSLPTAIVEHSANPTADLEPSTEHAEAPHEDLCPLGAAETRWYLCRWHGPGLVFQAGSGHVDAVANSCPLCARFCGPFHGCACEYSRNLLNSAERPGRRIRIRQRPSSETESH